MLQLTCNQVFNHQDALIMLVSLSKRHIIIIIIIIGLYVSQLTPNPY